MNDITPSELRTMKLIAQGHQAKAAARIAGLSQWTVKCQIQAAAKKIGGRNATHAIALAIIGGIIKPEDLQ